MGSGGESSVCLWDYVSCAVDATSLLMNFELDGHAEVGEDEGEDDAEEGDEGRRRFPGRADEIESLGNGLCFGGVGGMSKVYLLGKSPW
jgi:hypothetical protein